MKTMSASPLVDTVKAFLHSLNPSRLMRVALLAVCMGVPPCCKAGRSRQAASAPAPGVVFNCRSQRKGACGDAETAIPKIRAARDIARETVPAQTRPVGTTEMTMKSPFQVREADLCATTGIEPGTLAGGTGRCSQSSPATDGPKVDGDSVYIIFGKPRRMAIPTLHSDITGTFCGICVPIGT